MDPDAKKKLKAKLREKKESRKNGTPIVPPDLFSGETDILKIMEQVNKVLKTNPQMVQKIGNVVSNVMNNRELLNNLSKQVEDQIVQDQTLERSSPGESSDALSNESTQ
jgi:hypothetical protein